MIKPEDFENERVIWREVCDLRPFKIPEDSIKCPDCKGSGKIIKLYRDPGPNEYMRCFTCDGKGFIPQLKKDKL